MPQTKQAKQTMSRRAFLRLFGILGAGAVIQACDVLPEDEHVAIALEEVASPYPASNITASDVNRFLYLSTILTGFSDLNPELAHTYMQNLSGDVSLPELYEQANFPEQAQEFTLEQLQQSGVFEDEAMRSLLNEITNYWYTGTYQNGDSTVVATYTDALAWKSLDFTKPRTICGAPGFWQTNPYLQR